MAAVGDRQWAPVAAPPPPKPPQLNLVASSLMPDVRTDVFGPGAGPMLASAGWAGRMIEQPKSQGGDRRSWDRPPGDELYRPAIEKYNALVAAIATMSDVEMKQVEQEAGVTWDSLPASIFGATADSRWTGGFAYAPENQYPGSLADPCGQAVDLPYLTQNGLGAPTATSATPSNSGGHLTHAHGAYSYVVTAVDARGGQGAPCAAFTGTIASGSTGSNALAWTAPSGAVTAYNVYGRDAGAYQLIATVTGTSFTDTGAAGPTIQQSATGNLPQVLFVPFLIQVEDQASAWGWEARDFVGRALRLLDNATPNAIEREFWTGLFAQNTLTGPFNGTNAFLQQGATASAGGTGVTAVDLTPGGGPPSITRGLQILEDYLANTGFGGQGMLHVAPETSPNLLGARRVGSLLLSVMDNIIVPGSGYPTSGATGPIGATKATPDAGTQWIFASDLVSVRLDEPEVTPETMAEALDRGSFGSPNLIRFRAQRFAAATFDVARLAACRVTLTS